MNGLLRFFKIVYFHHRNSQKRIIFKDAVYFVTSKTHNNYPYFRERIFCDLFIENLRLCKQLKGFLLFGWVLNYDHFHSQIQPNDKWNISNVMYSIKKQFAHDVNRVIGFNKPYPHMEADKRLPASGGNIYLLSDDIRKMINKHQNYVNQLSREFKQKCPTRHPYPKFRWQSSFFDEYIRNDKSFDNHLDYIIYNLDKHNLPSDWPYVYTNPKYDDLTDD